METQLATTNLWLAVMAIAAILEALIVMALGIAALVAIRAVSQAVKRLDAEQITPALGRVNAILDDVKDASGTVKSGAGHFDAVVRTAATAFQTLFDKQAASSKRRERVM